MKITLRHTGEFCDTLSNRIFTLTKTVDWPVCPQAGDHVELADGWCSEGVTSRTFLSEGHIIVQLKHSSYRKKELEDLKKTGWQEI